MAKAILSDGRVLEPDLSMLTIAEYRSMITVGSDLKQEDEDALVARIYGLTVEELLSLSQPDYRRVTMAFLKAAMEPLSDPNSQSASTLASSEQEAVSLGNTGDGSSLNVSGGPLSE